jgi:hypothetical protein
MKIKLISIQVFFLLAICHCCLGSYVIDWTYEYGVASAGTKSESVYGKLLFKGDELPKEFQHVITPIGEFVYTDHRGFGSNDTVAWVPYGKVRGILNAAVTEADVQAFLTSNDSSFRRIIITHAPATVSTAPCLAGSLDQIPTGAGKNWFFVVGKNLWVNPAKINDVLKTKFAGRPGN